jgi:hypothetical protein
MDDIITFALTPERSLEVGADAGRRTLSVALHGAPGSAQDVGIDAVALPVGLAAARSAIIALGAAGDIGPAVLRLTSAIDHYLARLLPQSGLRIHKKVERLGGAPGRRAARRLAVALTALAFERRGFDQRVARQLALATHVDGPLWSHDGIWHIVCEGAASYLNVLDERDIRVDVAPEHATTYDWLPRVCVSDNRRAIVHQHATPALPAALEPGTRFDSPVDDLARPRSQGGWRTAGDPARWVAHHADAGLAYVGVDGYTSGCLQLTPKSAFDAVAAVDQLGELSAAGLDARAAGLRAWLVATAAGYAAGVAPLELHSRRSIDGCGLVAVAPGGENWQLGQTISGGLRRLDVQSCGIDAAGAGLEQRLSTIRSALRDHIVVVVQLGHQDPLGELARLAEVAVCEFVDLAFVAPAFADVPAAIAGRVRHVTVDGDPAQGLRLVPITGG